MENDSFFYAPIKTERLHLRQLTEKDKHEIFELQSSIENQRYIDRPIMSKIEQASAFIEKINNGIQNEEWLYWAICERNSNKLIGTICLWNFSKNKSQLEFGYELNIKYRGSGYMGEAVKAVIDFGLNKLRLKSIEAYTNQQNFPSIKILENNGFVFHKTILEKCQFKEGTINMSVYVLNK